MALKLPVDAFHIFWTRSRGALILKRFFMKPQLLLFSLLSFSRRRPSWIISDHAIQWRATQRRKGMMNRAARAGLIFLITAAQQTGGAHDCSGGFKVLFKHGQPLLGITSDAAHFMAGKPPISICRQALGYLRAQQCASQFKAIGKQAF